MAEMAAMTDYQLAQVRFEMGNPAEAARILAPLAVEAPRNVAVRLLLARSYYHSAQLRRAESEFRAVTELDPVEDYALFGLARSLERQSNHGAALPYFRLAAAMRPDPEYLDALGRAEARVAKQETGARPGRRGTTSRAAREPAAQAASVPAADATTRS
jgi:tetratricopeptide (TPR) repeat protein